jgi:HNH endonuclease
VTGQPDPKPPPRLVTSDWKPLRAQKTGPCRACGSYQWVELHHAVPRSLGGGDVEDNLLPLCHTCHMEWEDRGQRWPMIAAAVRDSLSPAEHAYIVQTKGEDFLERYYPAGGSCPACGRKPRKQREPRTEAPRQRKRWQIQVPADAEDGATILDTLIGQAREKIGREEGTPVYFTLVEVLAVFVRDAQGEAA